MKIRVESVFAVGARTWVEFSCALGRGQAIWKGEASPGDHEVTLELSPPIDVTPAMMRVPLLDAGQDGCRLRGLAQGGVLTVPAPVPMGDSDARISIAALPSGWMAVQSGPLLLSIEVKR